MISRTITTITVNVPNLIDAKFWEDMEKFANKWDLLWSVGRG